MHVHIGFLELVTFALYYVILKAALLFANIEARRNGWTTLAGVTGYLA